MTGRPEKFIFENLTDDKKKEVKIAQATVTIERVVRNNELWDVEMKLNSINRDEALDSHLASWILGNQPQLVDPQGKKIDYAAVESSSRTGNEVGLTFSYDIEKLDGCKWIVQVQQ